jgi:hypothetical protein
MRSSSIFLKRSAAALAGVWFLAPRLAEGQELSTQVGARDPFGLDRAFSFGTGGGAIPGISTDLKAGVTMGVAASTVYNSNIFNSDDDPQGSVFSNFSSNIAYSSDPEGGADIVFNAFYTPTYSAYWDDQDLSSFQNSGGMSLAVTGGRTTLSLTGGYSEVAGTDRLAGEFVNGALLSLALQGGYQLAPRTSVNAGATYSSTYYSSGASVAADVRGANAGAFWAATERFSFGPAISYSSSESDNIGKRDTWSATVQANYQAGEKIHVAGSLGTQWSNNSRDPGSSDAGLTGGLDATYNIDERWSWNGSVQYVTVPSPTEMNYAVNNLSLSTGVSRNLDIGTASAGISYTVSDYQSVGPVASELGNERFSSVYLGYQRGFLNDRLGFNSSIRYSLNRGQTEWNQIVISLGLSMSF